MAQKSTLKTLLLGAAAVLGVSSAAKAQTIIDRDSLKNTPTEWRLGPDYGMPTQAKAPTPAPTDFGFQVVEGQIIFNDKTLSTDEKIQILVNEINKPELTDAKLNKDNEKLLLLFDDLNKQMNLASPSQMTREAIETVERHQLKTITSIYLKEAKQQ